MPYDCRMNAPAHPYISVAASIVGGTAALARGLKVSRPTVSQWIHKERPVPEGRCPDIERLARARVTVDQLRPDLRWARVPDPAWPHPDGRPCIDVADPAAGHVASFAGESSAVDPNAEGEVSLAGSAGSFNQNVAGAL